MEETTPLTSRGRREGEGEGNVEIKNEGGTTTTASTSSGNRSNERSSSLLDCFLNAIRRLERPMLFLAGMATFALLNRYNTPSSTISTGDYNKAPSATKDFHKDVKTAADAHAAVAKGRLDRCRNIDWEEACDMVGGAGDRRDRDRGRRLDGSLLGKYNILENALLDSDDPTVIYDENCLRVYRLDLDGQTKFPYHANQLLVSGGHQTMTVFIQHGAMRDADNYFCSFQKLLREQSHRPFDDILVITPDFNYRSDPGVHPMDAFWNATKPWGDWRVGAQSDPQCCGNNPDNKDEGSTISSFDVLDHMLGLLTNRKLYPNMEKVVYLGHSAGGQMVQRYAIMSLLAAAYDEDDIDWVDFKFIVANPSSYTYLDERRFMYACGDCNCGTDNCTCDQVCETPSATLGIPKYHGVGVIWPCYTPSYNNWPYGLNKFADFRHDVPYVIKSGPSRASRAYHKRHVVYLVGQNDTCNDGLPTCDSSCWKREVYDPIKEWPCYRNSMDTRCPAMLEGPFRRTRGLQYMKYLETFYGKPTHKLQIVPGVGHNATGIFSSKIALQEIFE